MKAKDILGAFLSGICLVLIFPKLQWGGLAWFALLPLLLSLKGQPAASAFRLGLITGLVYFWGTLYWIPHTLTVYGKLPLLLSWGILFILVAFLALYVGGFAWGITWCGEGSFLPAPVLAAVWWVSLEYLRTYLLTGFPWVLLGYSQVPHLSMIQVAEFSGVYGLSFLIVLANAAIADFLRAWLEKPGGAGKSWRELPWQWPATVLLLLGLCFGYGRWQLTTPVVAAAPLKVAVLQGNIPQDQKWDPQYQEEVFQTYRNLSLQAVREARPQLLVWPEAATPFYFQSNPVYRPRLLQLARECGSFLFFGSPGYMRANDQMRPFNAAYLVSAQGEELGSYQKIHLVPFGEYVPLAKLFSFAGKLVAQAGNFVNGQEYTLLSLNSTRLGTAICYEIIFPDLVRRFVKNGATVLVNITNDAWFGKTAAPYQHFAMLSLRAVENRRYIVRSANTGISGFVDPWGRILKQGGIFTREYLTQEIAPQRGLTFYSRWGDVFAISCLLMVFASLIVSYKARSSNLCKRS